ncbi:MAG: hypothetical protein J2P24_19660 [Streptosporangiales bacterium]|nr:hypothetical protein [Streptosporangiales bacterium]MBO0889649.1 hypothetical protein [Acidothermales bacterium]
MRIYLPTTLPGLADLARCGALRPAPLDGYAVTPALREWYVDDDVEELEYAAMTAAARHSLRLLAAASPEDSGVPPRRVVVAADVPDADVTPVGRSDSDPAAIRVGATVPFTSVVSAHVDDPHAQPDVAAAVRALPDADAGDDDARFTVDEAEAHELAWYAVQEIPDLV